MRTKEHWIVEVGNHSRTFNDFDHAHDHADMIHQRTGETITITYVRPMGAMMVSTPTTFTPTQVAS